MKRDMDLMREILLQYEATEQRCLSPADVIGDDFDRSGVVNFHFEMMLEDALLFETNWGISPTNKGYDLLDMIRDDEIWADTKKTALSAGRFTGEVLVALAKGFVKHKVEKHTGLEIDL